MPSTCVSPFNPTASCYRTAGAQTTATPLDCKEIDTTTRIDKEFTDFCTCDDRKPEYCWINVAEREFARVSPARNPT